MDAIVGRARRLLRHEVLLIIFGVWVFMRSQWIAEDGYIYFAYVHNFLGGDGAVYNLGEKVEGFTSPAWFLLLSGAGGLGRLAGVGLRISALALSHLVVIATMIVLVRVNDRVVAKASRHAPSSPKLNVPLLLFVGFAVIQHFATSGLETPLIMLFCALCGSVILCEERPGWRSYALLALAPWVRPDLVLVGALPVLCSLWVRKRILWRSSLLVVGSWLVLEAGRIWYYAALLPNTYYAKTGLAGLPKQGILYLRDLLHAYGIQWLVVFALLATLLRFMVVGDKEDARRRLLLFFGGLLFGVYVVRIGGDFMHGRFWIPSLMLLFLSFAGQGGLLLGAVQTRCGSFAAHSLRIGLAVTLMGVSLFQGPTQTAVSHRTQSLFAGISSERDSGRSGSNRRLNPWRFKNRHRFAEIGRDYRRLSKQLEREVGGAHGGIGQPGYYGRLADGRVYILDLLGLTQPVVARLEPNEVFDKRRIGHKKVAPHVWVVLHPRVTFGSPYFPQYAEAFAVEAYGTSILDLTLLEDAEGSGLRDAEVERMKSYIRARVVGPRVDANLVYFFYRRYRLKDGVREDIERAYKRLPRKSQWEAWFDRHSEALSHVDRQIHNEGNFFDNLRLAFVGHFRRAPFEFLDDEPDWAVLR